MLAEKNEMAVNRRVVGSRPTGGAENPASTTRDTVKISEAGASERDTLVDVLRPPWYRLRSPSMSTKHFIALDTHCGFCQMAAVNAAGKVIRRERIETTIPKLVEAIESIRKPRVLTFEEGPLAGWLSRSLEEHVEQLIVCEPRRNALIAKEGDKDDPVDAEKLAQLFRGGFLKKVHQAETLDRAVLKQHVGFYHDRIRERVRQGHQLTCQLRRHGVFYGIEELKSCETRTCAWRELPNRRVLRADLDLLWKVYELLLDWPSPNLCTSLNESLWG